MADKSVLAPLNPEEGRQSVQWMREWNEAHVTEGHPRRGVFVLTLGCQQNESDSEKLIGMAEAMGYEAKDTPEEADLIMVNTCAVREHAEVRALSLIGQYKHLKSAKPDLIIGVCGCMMAQEHRREEIRRRYPYVSFTLGTASLHHLPAILRDVLGKKHRRITSDSEDEAVSYVAEGLPAHRASSYRAWVTVMYGCNNFCSYCIVPYVRGRERSRRPEEIIREVQDLVDRGYRDITLLGQNVNSYGKGTETDFADLLSELDRIPGDYWLRFMTSHPKDAGHKLIDVMADSTHIVHQFHLPLQCGSDRVLKAMNRHYDLEKYRSTVSYMRERMPDVVLTSDMMIGFPGETEEDFRDTLRALEEIRFDMLYSFIYSPRKGTPAALQEQIPDEVKSERFGRLLEAQNGISAACNEPFLNRTVRVLCDGPSKNDPSVYSGRTEGNKMVFFKGTPDLIGQFVPVRITKTDTFSLNGEVQA